MRMYESIEVNAKAWEEDKKFMVMTTIRPEIHARLQQIKERLNINLRGRDNNIVDIETTRKISVLPQHGNYKIFQWFLDDLNVFRDWKQKKFFGKMYMIIVAPILFVMRLTIPMFDYTTDRHGWNKLLNIFNILILPRVTLFITLGENYKKFYFKI